MAITSLSHIASTTSAEPGLTASASIQAGDLLIYLNFANSSSSGAPTLVTPTGFTNVLDTSNSFCRIAIHYKIADGSEASASYTGMNGSFDEAATLSVFRANVAIAAVTAAGNQSQVSDTNPSSKTILSGSGVAPLVVIAGWSNSSDGNAIDPRTQSPAMTEIAGPNTHQYTGWKFYSSSPADQTFDMADEGVDNALAGCYFQLSDTAPTVNGEFFNVF